MHNSLTYSVNFFLCWSPSHLLYNHSFRFVIPATCLCVSPLAVCPHPSSFGRPLTPPIGHTPTFISSRKTTLESVQDGRWEGKVGVGVGGDGWVLGVMGECWGWWVSGKNHMGGGEGLVMGGGEGNGWVVRTIWVVERVGNEWWWG